jgi:acyl-CoA synthetase (AMP-forming)/AMP-acid ligase II
VKLERANIASHLTRMASERPDAPAIIFPQGRDGRGRVSYTHLTYRQLDDESERIARGLIRLGIARGTRTVLMVKPSLELFSITFALFKAGIVPVLVDPGIGISALGRCLHEARPEAFIGIPAAHAARVLLGWARPTIRARVTVGRRCFWGGHTLEQVLRAGSESGGELGDVAPDDPAAIIFTSGSTGVPKGVLYTHANFAAQVRMIRDTFAITPGEVDLPTFPLFALFDPALGMTTIIPDMDATRPARVDPEKIREAIENFGVTNMFGSPALLRRVGEHGATLGWSFPTLRRVISAGAPVSGEIIETFTKLLGPGARIFTPYGATESLPVSVVGSEEILSETRARTREGAGVCVGRPVEGARVSVIPITEEPIGAWSESLAVGPGTVGEIVVRGPQVTRGYFGREKATAAAKIAAADGGFYHRMGDLGYFDEKGRLWFCGRKAHRVVLAEETLYTIPCEGVFNAHPEVARTALVGANKDGRTVPVLCVELRSKRGAADRKRISRELLALGSTRPHTKEIRAVLFHPAFPVDTRHNSKIFREKLAVWASGRLP